MTVALALPSLTLTDDETRTIGKLRSDIVYYSNKNQKRYALYEGEFVADQIGIAVPPMLKDWPVKIGWGTTIVDVIAERMNWIEFEAPGADLMGLDEIATRNRLQTKADQVTESCLVAGTTFVVIGKDAMGVVVESKSPSVMAVERNYVTDQIVAALSQVRDRTGRVVAETLYLPDQTITMQLGDDNKMAVTNRDSHKRGEVPVEQFKNQPNDSHPNGRSLITAPIEYSISAAARTLLGMEVHREFFAAPQRAALGAEPEMFGFTDSMTADEKYALGWAITMGRMNIVPPVDDGNGTISVPTMHEFKPSSPSVYIDILKYLSVMVASDSGLPGSYFGIMTDNPASSDSIKALESRIERRSMARTKESSWHWLNVARKALLWRDGRVDATALAKVRNKWASTSTPTPSAAADSGMKLVSAEILPKDSKVTYDRIGLSDTEQATLAEEKRRAAAATLPARIREAASQVTDPTVTSLASRRVPAEGMSGATAQ